MVDIVLYIWIQVYLLYDWAMIWAVPLRMFGFIGTDNKMEEGLGVLKCHNAGIWDIINFCKTLEIHRKWGKPAWSTQKWVFEGVIIQ